MTFAALIAVALAGFVYLLDRRLRVRGIRLGEWTTRVPWFRKGRVFVRGVPMYLNGWCENCKTGWRYALPYVTLTRHLPSDPVRAYVVVCERCRLELPLEVLVRRYAEWWVEKNEALPEGEYPDPREFEDIKSALRISA